MISKASPSGTKHLKCSLGIGNITLLLIFGVLVVCLDSCLQDYQYSLPATSSNNFSEFQSCWEALISITGLPLSDYQTMVKLSSVKRCPAPTTVILRGLRTKKWM